MSSDIVIEKVPRFTRRYGDYVVEGSNNTTIIMGTDRAKKGPATRADGLGHINAANKGAGTGTVHIIAGRAAEDPDLAKDDSYLYLTRKSKVDDNLGLAGVEQAQNEKPGAILKSDLIRIVGRKDIKVCANDDDKHYLFMDGKKIFIRMGSKNTIEMDENKIDMITEKCRIVMDTKESHIFVRIGSTKMNFDGSEIKIDSPKVHLTGGCEAPWDDLFVAMVGMMENHNHMSAVGPTTPALVGPATATPDATLTTKKTAWDSKVKS